MAIGLDAIKRKALTGKFDSAEFMQWIVEIIEAIQELENKTDNTPKED